jgi:flagellar hook-basal body complex protein FliE
VKTSIIDSSHIQEMMAQLKAVASRASAGAHEVSGSDAVRPGSFADVLKSNLDSVNSMQQSADSLGRRFAIGDDSVNLSDVMIATQKASISFQAAVQVRNKLVSAYHDIMSMQV